MSNLGSASHAINRPIRKLAGAISKCGPEATAYGRCVVADYDSVGKDKCVREFMKLKDCYLAVARKS